MSAETYKIGHNESHSPSQSFVQTDLHDTATVWFQKCYLPVYVIFLSDHFYSVYCSSEKNRIQNTKQKGYGLEVGGRKVSPGFSSGTQHSFGKFSNTCHPAADMCGTQQQLACFLEINKNAPLWNHFFDKSAFINVIISPRIFSLTTAKIFSRP